jgi:carbon-monoxide dehydrogenase medium subunit
VTQTCEYVRARTIEEALEQLEEERGVARVIAGGVALVGLMNQKLFAPTYLVDISRLAALQGIRQLPAGELRVGALVTHGEIERAELIRRRVPLLHEMAREIACGRIRNRGTIGGNLCHADPQEDPPAALLALGATLRLCGRDGSRDVPIDGFFQDSFATALRETELLEEVIVPPPPPNSGSAYTKFGPRRAMDYTSTISVAVMLARDPSRGRITDIRIGMSGVAPTPIRARSVEAILRDQRPDPEVLEQAKRSVADDIDPSADFYFSADYKRHVAGVLVGRTVQRAYDSAREAS